MVFLRSCFLCLLGLIPLSGVSPSGLAGSAPIPFTWTAAFTSTASTEAWPALPVDTWAIKASDYPDGAGALVLQERVHFHYHHMERFRRLLVLAEPGRSLADFQLIGAKVKNLEGRTITQDGTVQPFVQNGDIVKAVLLSGKRENLDAVKVIPPGVTGHCVVDVRWIEPIDAAQRPVPDTYDYNLLFSLSGAAPVRLSEVIFDDNLSDFGWMKKFEVQPGQNYRQTSGGGSTSYIFENIPARPKVPLASVADLRSPVFSWFLVPQVREWLTFIGYPEDKALSVLDASAKTVFYRYLAEPVEKNRGFRSSLWTLGQGVDGTVRQRSEALIKALRSKMKTIAELPSRPSRNQWEAGMDAALKRGWGTHQQLCMVGFHLLWANQLDVSLVLAIDREENRVLDPNNIWQYDYMLLSVLDEKGQPIYFNPGSTFYPVGAPPWTQGSRALVIHPGKERVDWSAQITSIPSMPAEVNPQTWKVAIRPDSDSDEYEVSFQAGGHAASSFRTLLSDRPGDPLNKALEPLVQQHGFMLRKASGTSVMDSWAPLDLTFQGIHEHEQSRHRLILPFPFLHAPFQLPSSWPATRTIDIHFPQKTVIDAEARIAWQGALPEVADLPPIQHENDFGRVTWNAQAVDGKAGKELLVKLVVKVHGIKGTAALYPDLKAFTRWIQEALERGVPAPRP